MLKWSYSYFFLWNVGVLIKISLSNMLRYLRSLMICNSLVWKAYVLTMRELIAYFPLAQCYLVVWCFNQLNDMINSAVFCKQFCSWWWVNRKIVYMLSRKAVSSLYLGGAADVAFQMLWHWLQLVEKWVDSINFICLQGSLKCFMYSFKCLCEDSNWL